MKKNERDMGRVAGNPCVVDGLRVSGPLGVEAKVVGSTLTWE